VSTPSSGSIAGNAVRGAGWTILTGIFSRALGLVGTLALTHFLAPDVQGEVSDAYIVVLTANMFTTLGVLHYLVAKPKDAGPEVGFHITVVHLTIGAVALALVTLLRDQFGVALNAPNMGMYVPGFAVALFLERMGQIPERILARHMLFRKIGLGRTYSEITYSIVSVLLAMTGMGGMAIVWGNIARSAIYLACMFINCDRREWLQPCKLRREVLRPVFAFGLPLAIGSWASFASRRWDNLVISAMFGPRIVGEYNLAYNLADIPAIQVGEQVGEVLLPSFAHMPPAERKDALIRSTGLLSLVIFPLAVGLGAVAPSLVKTLLRPEWAGVAPMLMVLSALSVTRPFGFTIASYLQASNLPRAAMWLNLSKVAILLGSVVLLGQLGPLWACVGVGVAFGIQAHASMAVVAQKDAIRIGAFLRPCVGPLLACVPMALAVTGVRIGLAELGLDARGVSLVVELVVGAVTYVLSAFLFARTVTRELLDLVRAAARRRRGGGDDATPAPRPSAPPRPTLERTTR
jgi:PST family polysaccharide transporter